MGKLVFPALNTVGNENNVASCGQIDPDYQRKIIAGRKSSESRLLGSLVKGRFLVHKSGALCSLFLSRTVHLNRR